MRGLHDSVCARILVIYVLMVIGGIVGWGCFTWLSHSLTPGRMDSQQIFDCLCYCLFLPFETISIGPLVVSLRGGMLLAGPGIGILGLVLLLALSGSQYVLLVVAIRRTLCKRIWMWGGFLAGYSALFAYVFPTVVYST